MNAIFFKLNRSLEWLLCIRKEIVDDPIKHKIFFQVIITDEIKTMITYLAKKHKSSNKIIKLLKENDLWITDDPVDPNVQVNLWGVDLNVYPTDEQMIAISGLHFFNQMDVFKNVDILNNKMHINFDYPISLNIY
jgi:hypothetical protein